jgi:hypothetical protein
MLVIQEALRRIKVTIRNHHLEVRAKAEANRKSKYFEEIFAL